MQTTRQTGISRGLAAVAALGLLLASGEAAPGARSPQPHPKRPALSGGATSVDALVRDLLAALEKKDEVRLHALRVSEREYLEVILPGGVEPGQRPQTMPARKAKYFWDVLDAKSAYGERHLLQEFGGKAFKLKELAFKKGGRRFATYKGHEQLRLKVEDEQGAETEIATGSIVEVAGKFKFVSFVRD